MGFIDFVLEVLNQSSAPLNADEIARKVNNIDSNNKFITPSQVRDRIRKNYRLIDTIKSNPNKYKIKKQTQSLWVLKTVPENDKASQTDSYEDNLKEFYNYDNLVANSKQVSANDLAILIDKEKILGFARIGIIKSTNGQKTIRRCPECPSTTIDKRKTKNPTYRCNKGHEFDIPSEEVKDVIKYSAHFTSFIPIGTLPDDLKQLRPYYSQGYNQNMSMQRLDIAALTSLFHNIQDKLDFENTLFPTLSPYEGVIRAEEDVYEIDNKDEREISLKSIRLRRGQQDFRKKLLEKYNSTCVITNCKIVDILEAAHINPYRGNNDNHISNGLLLRADIHTLFDLDLIKINSEHYTVEIDKKLIGSEYEQYDGRSLIDYEKLISKEALKIKFQQKNKGS